SPGGRPARARTCVKTGACAPVLNDSAEWFQTDGKLAEEEGFEPSSPFRVARFPVVCARPLRDSSEWRRGRDLNPRDALRRLTVCETASFGPSDPPPHTRRKRRPGPGPPKRFTPAA